MNRGYGTLAEISWSALTVVTGCGSCLSNYPVSSPAQRRLSGLEVHSCSRTDPLFEYSSDIPNANHGHGCSDSCLLEKPEGFHGLSSIDAIRSGSPERSTRARGRRGSTDNSAKLSPVTIRSCNAQPGAYDDPAGTAGERPGWVVLVRPICPHEPGNTRLMEH